MSIQITIKDGPATKHLSFACIGDAQKYFQENNTAPWVITGPREAASGDRSLKITSKGGFHCLARDVFPPT